MVSRALVATALAIAFAAGCSFRPAALEPLDQSALAEDGAAPDDAALTDAPTPLDVAAPDLTVLVTDGPAADATVVADLADGSVGADLRTDASVVNDLTAADDATLVPLPDLQALPDLVVLPDILVIPDIVVVPDLVVFPDLVAVADLKPVAGSLAVTAVDRWDNGTVVDFSATKTHDWAHWGRSAVTDFNHRSGTIVGRISDISVFGPGAGGVDREPSWPIPGFSWSDGTPTTMATAVTAAPYVETATSGFTFTAPASQTPRTLRVFVAGYKSRGQFTATLSDASAGPYVNAGFESMAQGYYVVFNTVYNSATDNQTLTLQWQMTVDYNPAGAHTLAGDVGIFAATLN